jgi:hypothetical protein
MAKKKQSGEQKPEQVSGQAEEKPADGEPKVNKPWEFQPGQSGNPSGQRKPPPKYVPPDEGVDSDLADMQHVYRNHDDRHDKTGGQHFQREASRRQPVQWDERRRLLEANRKSSVAGAASAAPDKSTQECVALARALLVKLKGGG